MIREWYERNRDMVLRFACIAGAIGCFGFAAYEIVMIFVGR